MLSNIKRRSIITLCAALMGCTTAPQTDVASAINEVSSRAVAFPKYPQVGQTYLSFSSAHGFQVSYVESPTQSHLWYPGNRVSLREDYKRDVIRDTPVLCFRHGNSTYNPVTKQSGGKFACTPLKLARQTVVARLSGDPYTLAAGTLPYRLDRCKAPDAFQFDRAKFKC